MVLSLEHIFILEQYYETFVETCPWWFYTGMIKTFENKHKFNDLLNCVRERRISIQDFKGGTHVLCVCQSEIIKEMKKVGTSKKYNQRAVIKFLNVRKFAW